MIIQVSDREIALQAQLAAMTASRDECQQAADKMAWDHKVERDTLRQHIKHIGNDAMRSENHELRQQLAEAQRQANYWKFLTEDCGDLTPFLREYHSGICFSLDEIDVAMKGGA
jgi:hypothetical protein